MGDVEERVERVAIEQGLYLMVKEAVVEKMENKFY